MIEYKDYSCPVCNKQFGEEDDIVVCPECGTPYHRECYKTAGCVNTALHGQQQGWRARAVEEQEAPKCASCGNALRPDQLFCDKCGTPSAYYYECNGTKQPAGYRALYMGEKKSPGGTGINEKEMGELYSAMNITDFGDSFGSDPKDTLEDDVTVAEAAEFIGPNKLYYMPKFLLMHRFGIRFYPNLAALLFPEIYLAYRKMTVQAIVVFILRFIISLPAMALSLQTVLGNQDYYNMFIAAYGSIPALVEKVQAFLKLELETGSFGVLNTVSSIMETLLIFSAGCFANRIYYDHCIKRISEIKSIPLQVDKEDMIIRRGGTSIGLAVLFAVLVFMRAGAAAAVILMLV
ncbi:MAG: hypothetical protein IJ149_00360 [Oscillospiraceae bacterium]|nr:hypothetical protein [Oscillospiraceae bacterium]